MASIGNINRGIYLIIDAVDYKMLPKPQQACLLGRLEDGRHHFTTSRVFQAKERKIYHCRIYLIIDVVDYKMLPKP